MVLIPVLALIARMAFFGMLVSFVCIGVDAALSRHNLFGLQESKTRADIIQHPQLAISCSNYDLHSYRGRH